MTMVAWQSAMNTLTSEEIQKECLDEKLFAAAGTNPGHHIHGKYCVHCHIHKHECSNAATFIQKQDQGNNVQG